jgi:hypothetical protein
LVDEEGGAGEWGDLLGLDGSWVRAALLRVAGLIDDATHKHTH